MLLNQAVEMKDVKVICNVLSQSIDVNLANPDGYSPLHTAAVTGHLDTLNLLLNARDIDVNVKNLRDETPLHLAAMYNKIEIMERLLSRGADVNVQHNSGWTPLHFAVYHSENDSHLRACEVLLANGPDVDVGKETPLVVCLVRTGTRVNRKIVRLLVDDGADINARSGYLGNTALHIAVSLNKIAAIEIGILHGADVNARNNRGSTPLHCAARGCENDSHLEVAKRLLENGANPNALDSRGCKPLQYLRSDRHNGETFELFLDYETEFALKRNLVKFFFLYSLSKYTVSYENFIKYFFRMDGKELMEEVNRGFFIILLCGIFILLAYRMFTGFC